MISPCYCSIVVGGGTDGGDESGRPSIKFKSMKDILDSSYSDLEDLPDIPTKGEKDSDGKKSDKKDEDKGKDKKVGVVNSFK